MSVAGDNELNNNMPSDSPNSTVITSLIQNPNSSHPINTTISEVPSYYNLSSHTTNFLSLNHHLVNTNATIDRQTRVEFMEQPSWNSRWNATPEQLLALEEIYRRGTQSQSKRKTETLRREMEINTEEEKLHNMSGEKKKSVFCCEMGLRKTSNDIEQTQNWAASSNCSKYSEEFVSMHRAVATAESTSGPQFKWTQKRKGAIITADQMMNATSKTMKLPKTTNTSTQKLSGFSFLKPYYQAENYNFNHFLDDHHHENGETQTLQLFPLHSDGDYDYDSVSATKKAATW